MGYSAMETPRTPAAKVHRFWLAALVRAPAVEAVEAGVPVAVPPVTDMVGVEKSRVRVLVGMTKLVATPLVEGVATLSSGLLLGLPVGLLLGVSLAVTEAKVLETAAEEPLALTAPPQACCASPSADCCSAGEQDDAQFCAAVMNASLHRQSLDKGSQLAAWPAWLRHALMQGGMPTEVVLAGGALELEELPLRVAVDEDRDEAVVIAILLVAVLKVVGSL